MTILQLITRRQYRGAEVFAAQLSAELIKQGHQVILAGLYAPPKDKVLTVEGADNLDVSQKTARALPHFSILREIARLVKEREVSVVQANSSDNLKYAVLSQRLFGWQAPIVFRNASVLSAWLRGPLHRGINRWLLLQTAAIACVSRLSKQDLENNLNLPAERLHYLPIGTPLASPPDRELARAFLASQIAIPEDALIMIHVGAFSPEKNQHLLVKLLRELPDQLAGRPVHLVCVGEGALREKVMALAVESGVKDRAHFLGYRQDVPRFLAGADLFVLPSSIEGTPGVLLEAAAHGVAAVAFNVGAVAECFPEDIQSVLVPAENFEKLYAIVLRMLANQELCKEIAASTNKFVRNQYSLSSVAKDFANLYEKLSYSDA